MDKISDILLTALFASALTLMLVFWVLESILKKAKVRYTDIFKTFPITPEDVVMLGDSITDLTRWHELVPGMAIKNRGIANDTILDVLNRLDPVVSGKPLAVFLLIGTNDIPWYRFTSDEVILQRYESILRRFKEESPRTKVYVQSILPRDRRYSDRVRSLNERLKQLAAKHDYIYVDLFPHFADKFGGIRSELSNDKLHPLAVGYEVWVQAIQPYLEELRQQQAALRKSVEPQA